MSGCVHVRETTALLGLPRGLVGAVQRPRAEHRPTLDAHSGSAVSQPTGYRLLQHGNSVLALIEFPDAASAQAFQTDTSLGEAMDRAGVVGTPDISIWSEASQEQY